MNITVIPLGTASPSVGDYIADIEDLLNQRKINHALGDMGTVIQGTVDQLLTLAAELHEIPFNRGIRRVVTQITIDDRRDLERAIGDKRQAVYNRISEKRTYEEKK